MRGRIRAGRAALAALAAVLMLAGCGSDRGELELTELGRDLARRLAAPSVEEQAAATRAAVMAVTPEQVAASTLPLARLRIEGTGAAATIAEIDRKGPYSTWISGDGGAFLFRGGQLVATRGLGEDLMGMAGPGLREAVARGEITRTLRYLDGDEHLVDVPLRCLVERRPHPPITILDRTHAVEEIAEYCQGEDFEGRRLRVENFYWVRPGTEEVWQSRQFISWKFGRAEIEILKR